MDNKDGIVGAVAVDFINDACLEHDRIGNKKGETHRLSGLLVDPRSITLETIVSIAVNLGMGVSIVLYPLDGPVTFSSLINPQVFVKCWKASGSPDSMVSDSED